jgi:hypothetical protein
MSQGNGWTPDYGDTEIGVKYRVLQPAAWPIRATGK